MSPPQQLAWQTDARGKLRLAGIHDGHLAEFSYVSGQAATFVILGQGGETTRIHLERPIISNIRALWDGSIILHIFIWPIAEVPSVAGSDDETGWNALLSGRVTPDECAAEAARLAKAHPQAQLVTVACSYGGDWSVLCERVGIDQELPKSS